MDRTTIWLNDYMAGVAPLTSEERGVFTTLIFYFVIKDRVVPDDDAVLAHICNMGLRPYRRVRTVLIKGDFITIKMAGEDDNEPHIWIDKSSIQYEKDLKFSQIQSIKAKKKRRNSVAIALARNESGLTGAGAGAKPTNTPMHIEPTVPVETLEGAGRPEDEPRDKKGRPYAFCGKVLRIDVDDYAAWERSFSNLVNLRSMLQSRDDFLRELEPDKRGNVFFSTSSWLRNQDTEAAGVKGMGDGYL